VQVHTMQRNGVAKMPPYFDRLLRRAEQRWRHAGVHEVLRDRCARGFCDRVARRDHDVSRLSGCGVGIPIAAGVKLMPLPFRANDLICGPSLTCLE